MLFNLFYLLLILNITIFHLFFHSYSTSPVTNTELITPNLVWLCLPSLQDRADKYLAYSSCSAYLRTGAQKQDFCFFLHHVYQN